MKLLKKILVTVTALIVLLVGLSFVPSTNRVESFFFKETQSGLENNFLWIEFKCIYKKRTVGINISGRQMTFRGTTFRDFKWATNLEDGSYFSVSKNNFLSVHLANGNTHYFGIINEQTKSLLNDNLSDLIKKELTSE